MMVVTMAATNLYASEEATTATAASEQTEETKVTEKETTEEESDLEDKKTKDSDSEDKEEETVSEEKKEEGDSEEKSEEEGKEDRSENQATKETTAEGTSETTEGETAAEVSTESGQITKTKMPEAQPLAETEAVVKIGKEKYETLDQAVEEAKDGDTIELLKNCTTRGLNLNKNLTISGNHKIEFKEYGIALWGKNLTFENCTIEMKGISSTPYIGEWNRMTICASTIASLTLTNAKMTMDGTGTGNAHAIYFCSNNKLNLKSSTLTITNYEQDALEWDGGDGGYNINFTDSTFVSDHNRSGFTGTFYATFKNSTVNVINSIGNGSNGSHFIINDSKVNFNNNGSHGLSAGILTINNSKVEAIGNGGNGIHTTDNTTINNNSKVTIKNNRCSISSQWSIPGALHIGGSGDHIIENSTVIIEDNKGSGIYQKSKEGKLTIQENANVSIIRNTAEKLGSGGGIYVNGTVNLANNIVLYNNHAGTSGDDIYVVKDVSLNFGKVGTDWALDGEPDCQDTIDGWYDDAEGARWEAHDSEKYHIEELEFENDSIQILGLNALKAAHGIEPADPAEPVSPVDWDKSKSKTATNLDTNYESQVTLSLPSAEEELDSDVVFVLDKSTSAALEEQALAMLSELKDQIEKTNAKVKVGIVIFNKAANVTSFKDLATQYDEIKSAITQTIRSGTNTHAGLLAGKKMLDEDTSVDASRKYLIFVSDGITYMYNEKPTATAWSFYADAEKNWAGPDNWNSKYGSNDAPRDWSVWLGTIGKQVEFQGTAYEYPYGGTSNASTPISGQSTYANSIDKALYLTYKTYKDIADAGYHCYAMTANTSSGGQYTWGPSFMDYLSNGEQYSFADIQNDIIYLVDAGSYVDDYMGYVDGDNRYNFDFINGAAKLSIKVGDEELKAEKISDNEYGFGKQDDNSYKYTLTYVEGNKQDTEHFIWEINVPVSNFAPVQLTYSVQLMNPQKNPGDYGIYDADGSKGYEGLYTNNSATLYPMDSNGQSSSPEDFNNPTVSYSILADQAYQDPENTTNSTDTENAYEDNNNSITKNTTTNNTTTNRTTVKKTTTKKTGDDHPIGMYVALLACAVAIAGGVVVHRKRKGNI